MHKLFSVCRGIIGRYRCSAWAFGAHGLKKIVPPDTVNTFQTGVQYQMYHALALIAVAIVFEKFPNKLISGPGISFVLVSCCFQVHYTCLPS